VRRYGLRLSVVCAKGEDFSQGFFINYGIWQRQRHGGYSYKDSIMFLSSVVPEVVGMDRSRAEGLKVKPGLRKGYGLMKCPKPGCEHVLCEMSKRFWYTGQVERIVCPKCGGSASLIACLQTENDAGELLVRYWCPHCHAIFERAMFGVREYCRGCQTYHNIYFGLSLSLLPVQPQSPEFTSTG